MVCFNPTLIFCSDGFISKTLTLIFSPFLYLFNSSSPLFKNVKSLQCRKASISKSSIFTNNEYSFLFTTSPSTIVSTGYFLLNFQMDFLELICER